MRKLSEELKYFFSGSFFLGLSSIYSLVIPLIVIPYLIKNVELSGYGLSVIAFSVTFFLSLIIDFGYNISGVNMLSKSDSNEKKGEIIVTVIYTKIALLLILLFCFIIGILYIPYLRQHYVLYGYSFLITLSSVFNLNWALQGLQKIKTLSIINILNKTVYLLGVILVINKKEDYVFINLLYAIGIIISGLFSLYIISRKIPLILFPYRLNKFLEEIKMSGHYFISNISVYLSASVYPVILSFFVSNEMVGVFSIVEKIYNLLRSVFSIYINLMLPRISNLIESSIFKARSELKKTYIFVVVFVLFEIIAVWVFRHQVILFFTKEFVSLTVNLLEIAFIGILIVIFNCPIYLMLLALDKKKEIMKTFLIGPIIGILLCVLLSKYYGIFGAFYAVILTETFYSISLNFLFYVRKNLFGKRA